MPRHSQPALRGGTHPAPALPLAPAPGLRPHPQPLVPALAPPRPQRLVPAPAPPRPILLLHSLNHHLDPSHWFAVASSTPLGVPGKQGPHLSHSLPGHQGLTQCLEAMRGEGVCVGSAPLGGVQRLKGRGVPEFSGWAPGLEVMAGGVCPAPLVAASCVPPARGPAVTLSPCTALLSQYYRQLRFRTSNRALGVGPASQKNTRDCFNGSIFPLQERLILFGASGR